MVNTKPIRIISEGLFDKLMKKVEEQFETKHGFTPSPKKLCETIAKAVIDNKLF